MNTELSIESLENAIVKYNLDGEIINLLISVGSDRKLELALENEILSKLKVYFGKYGINVVTSRCNQLVAQRTKITLKHNKYSKLKFKDSYWSSGVVRAMMYKILSPFGLSILDFKEDNKTFESSRKYITNTATIIESSKYGFVNLISQNSLSFYLAFSSDDKKWCDEIVNRFITQFNLLVGFDDISVKSNIDARQFIHGNYYIFNLVSLAGIDTKSIAEIRHYREVKDLMYTMLRNILGSCGLYQNSICDDNDENEFAEYYFSPFPSGVASQTADTSRAILFTFCCCCSKILVKFGHSFSAVEEYKKIIANIFSKLRIFGIEFFEKKDIDITKYQARYYFRSSGGTKLEDIDFLWNEVNILIMNEFRGSELKLHYNDWDRLEFVLEDSETSTKLSLIPPEIHPSVTIYCYWEKEREVQIICTKSLVPIVLAALDGKFDFFQERVHMHRTDAESIFVMIPEAEESLENQNWGYLMSLIALLKKPLFTHASLELSFLTRPKKADSASFTFSKKFLKPEKSKTIKDFPGLVCTDIIENEQLIVFHLFVDLESHEVEKVFINKVRNDTNALIKRQNQHFEETKIVEKTLPHGTLYRFQLYNKSGKKSVENRTELDSSVLLEEIERIVDEGILEMQCRYSTFTFSHSGNHYYELHIGYNAM